MEFRRVLFRSVRIEVSRPPENPLVLLGGLPAGFYDPPSKIAQGGGVAGVRTGLAQQDVDGLDQLPPVLGAGRVLQRIPREAKLVQLGRASCRARVRT